MKKTSRRVVKISIKKNLEAVEMLRDNLIIINKSIIDAIIRECKGKGIGDALAVYTFLYYTAKWQGTNQPRATVEYISKGLGFCKSKVMKAKAILKKIGVISPVVKKDEKGKIMKNGHFVRMNFIWKMSTVDMRMNEATLVNRTVEIPV